MTKLLLLIIPILLIGASFDCEKAHSKTELLICDNSVLSELDLKMGNLYQHVKKKFSTEYFVQIKKSQLIWLKERNKISPQNICELTRHYQKRISYLDGLCNSNQKKSNDVKSIHCLNKIDVNAFRTGYIKNDTAYIMIC